MLSLAHVWTILAPTSNLLAIDVEDERYWYHGEAEESQQTRRPRNSKSVVHRFGEELAIVSHASENMKKCLPETQLQPDFES